MLNVGVIGAFAASLEGAIRRNLTVPCEIAVSNEAGIISRLAYMDVLVTMMLTQEMGDACTHLRLVQVPGAGLDRIERPAIPAGAWLANAYGHENGIAEYVIGAMLALTRDLVGLDAALRQGDWQSQWAIGVAPPPVWAELTGDSWLWQDRSGGRPARPCLRHEGARGAPRCPAFRRGRCRVSRWSGLDRRCDRPIRLRARLDAGDP